MGIVDKIKEKYPYLTRKQRDVANYMLEDVERETDSVDYTPFEILTLGWPVE